MTYQKHAVDDPEPQVTKADRDGRRLVCPDCGKRIGPSRGGHELPDGRRVHGWACEDCQNVFPGKCHTREAETWTDKIVGIEVEYRDGSTGLAAGFVSDVEERNARPQDTACDHDNLRTDGGRDEYIAGPYQWITADVLGVADLEGWR